MQNENQASLSVNECVLKLNGGTTLNSLRTVKVTYFEGVNCMVRQLYLKAVILKITRYV